MGMHANLKIVCCHLVLLPNIFLIFLKYLLLQRLMVNAAQSGLGMAEDDVE